MSTESKQQAASRRQFLQMVAAGSGAVLLAACGAANPAAEAPTAGGSAATSPTGAPAAGIATSAPAVASGTTNLLVMSPQSDFSDDTVKQIEAALPNIKIERVDKDLTRLNAMMAANTPPDIIQLSAPQVPLMVIQSQLLDLSEYFKGSNTLKADDLGPTIAYWKFDGKRMGEGSIYGMHKDWSPDLSLFIDLAAFKEAGIAAPAAGNVFTYAELAELAPKLQKKAGDRIERVGSHIEHGWIDGYVQRRLQEEGESLYTPDYSKAVIKDNPKVVDFITYVFNLSKQNLIWNPLNPSPTGWAGDDFLKGQMSILHMGYWYGGSIRSAKDSPIKDQIMMLPGATYSGKRANPSLGGAGFVISKNSKNVDAAWQAFEYYMGGQPAQDRAKSGWGVPALKSLYPLMPQETAFDKQLYAVLQDEMQYAATPMDINPFSKGWGFWVKHLESALRGDIDVNQLVANCDKDANADIADGRAAAGVV